MPSIRHTPWALSLRTCGHLLSQPFSHLLTDMCQLCRHPNFTGTIFWWKNLFRIPNACVSLRIKLQNKSKCFSSFSLIEPFFQAHGMQTGWGNPCFLRAVPDFQHWPVSPAWKEHSYQHSDLPLTCQHREIFS